MAPFIQEPSQCAPSDDVFICQRGYLETNLKRKRGYFPYTDDDESSLWNIKTPDFQPSPGIVRTFEDSIPWYQWKRKSFATREERVISFKLSDSESESEDDYFDAPEPEIREVELCVPKIQLHDPSVCDECSGLESTSVSLSWTEKLVVTPGASTAPASSRAP